MKQSKINRGLHLFGLALRVTTLDDETRLELTTRQAFKLDEPAHFGWAIFAFVVYTTILTSCLVLPIWLDAFDDDGITDIMDFLWYGFVWLLWHQTQRE